jgi:ABC-type phosphate/phosphonate transport system substrate-binding protein
VTSVDVEPADAYICAMCGRVVQSSGPVRYGKAFYATDYAGVIEAMRFNKVQIAWFGNKSGMEAVDRSNGEVFVTRSGKATNTQRAKNTNPPNASRSSQIFIVAPSHRSGFSS